MLMAVNMINQYIQAQAAATGKMLRCPACHQNVVLKRGQVKVAHFAHHKNSKCTGGFSEGESVAHLKGKLALYRWLRDYGRVELEPALGDIQQRPDLLLHHPDYGPIAVEYQCSPITAKRLAERNQGYQKLGIQVYWVLGPKYYQQQLRQTTIVRFLKNGRLNFYLPDQARFCYRSNFTKADFQRLRYQEQVSRKPRLGQTAWSTKKLDVQRQRQKLLQLLVQERVDVRVVDHLYQQGRYLGQVPDWVLAGQTFGLKVPNWHLRLVILLLLEQVGVQTFIHYQQLLERVRPYFLLDEELVNQALGVILTEMNQLGFVSQMGLHIQIQALPRWQK